MFRWRRRKQARRRALWALGIGAGVAGAFIVSRLRYPDWSGRVVLITGASRGLGFLLAKGLAREGCRLVLCARDAAELERARADLQQYGVEILTIACDVSDRAQVDHLIKEATARFGRIDVLINNAGIIQVGPVETMTMEDFERAMATNFWGVVYTTLAVLPSMLARRNGNIVNITSIGGKVSVPHLLPYNCAKFAAVGFSEGLRAELRGKGVQVTTIVPGLMRTGSYLNAMFKGKHEQESAWFSLGASLPGPSMSAERAAKQIVRAAKRGEAERILSIPAKLLARFHGLFPETSIAQLGLVGGLLPSAEAGSTATKSGLEVQSEPTSKILDRLTTMGRSAAERLHQYPV
jgi:short-subunit dehydrogenase